MRIGASACGWLVCGMLAISACTGPAQAIVTETPEPTGSPEVSPSVTEIPSPTPSASPDPLTDDELLAMMPDDASRDHVDGAIATAVFFLGQYGSLFQSGDDRAWSALSSEGCSYCERAIRDAQEVQSGGAIVLTGDILVRAATPVGTLDEDGLAHVLLTADVTRGTSETSAGAAIEIWPASTFEAAVILERSDGLWRVVEIVGEEVES